MRKTIPLIVAGILFSLVALMHLLRLIYQGEILVAGHMIPMSVSVGGFILTLIMAIWMFFAAW